MYERWIIAEYKGSEGLELSIALADLNTLPWTMFLVEPTSSRELDTLAKLHPKQSPAVVGFPGSVVVAE